jgi:type II secretory pathway component PulF
MPRFFYRAKKGPTEIIDDVIEAQSRDEAVEKISRLGYLPIKIQEEATALREKEAKSKAASVLYRGRVRSKDVTIFSRQLASLVKSGVPILRALNILSEQSESPAFRDVIAKISKDVKEGQSFSKSLESWPSAFSAFYVAMVRSGEDSGTLQETLLRIAAYRQKQEELMAKVKTAMAYPILMALVGAGTVIFMFVFVMPKLMAIFSTMGQELPIQTKIVIAISVFLTKKWPVLIVVIVALALLISKTSTFKARRRIMSAFVLRVPVFNRFLRFNEFARFSRTLEVMIKSGIPILRALAVSIPVLDNEIIKTELFKSAKDLEQGMSFGKSLAKSRIFPTFMISLILVGEESGKLDESLGEIADAYEHECDEAMKVLTSLLEPMMILVMGLIVGFIVMAMLLPIFQINVMVR